MSPGQGKAASVLRALGIKQLLLRKLSSLLKKKKNDLGKRSQGLRGCLDDNQLEGTALGHQAHPRAHVRRSRGWNPQKRSAARCPILSTETRHGATPYAPRLENVCLTNSMKKALRWRGWLLLLTQVGSGDKQHRSLHTCHIPLV